MNTDDRRRQILREVLDLMQKDPDRLRGASWHAEPDTFKLHDVIAIEGYEVVVAAMYPQAESESGLYRFGFEPRDTLQSSADALRRAAQAIGYGANPSALDTLVDSPPMTQLTIFPKEIPFNVSVAMSSWLKGMLSTDLLIKELAPVNARLNHELTAKSAKDGSSLVVVQLTLTHRTETTASTWFRAVIHAATQSEAHGQMTKLAGLFE